MKEKGLELKKIRSTCRLIGSIKHIYETVAQCFSEEAYTVIYLDYKVLIGRFKDSRFHNYNNESFEDTYLQRLRVFDGNKEVYIWRDGDGFKGRLRIDGEGDETDAIDAYQVVFGTKSWPLDGGYSRLTEDRGTELIVPIADLAVDNDKKRLFLKTRNYIGYTPTDQAGYVDCRFVGFSIG
ncbi:MAG: CRISPR-associated protein Csx19 [Thermodesulfovibrionales bacterium]